MNGYSPLKELNLLMDFQDVMGFGSYVPGFGLTEFGDFFALETRWSAQPAFLDRLIPFAQADAEGSFYALWRVDDFTELVHMPVIVFGAHGGTHVVATDIQTLLRVLALSPLLRIDEEQASYICDSSSTIEPDVVLEDSGVVDDVLLGGPGSGETRLRRAVKRRAPAMRRLDREQQPVNSHRPRRHTDYVEWLDEILGLDPATDCSVPVTEAQATFAEPYRQWVTPYLISFQERMRHPPWNASVYDERT